MEAIAEAFRPVWVQLNQKKQLARLLLLPLAKDNGITGLPLSDPQVAWTGNLTTTKERASVLAVATKTVSRVLLPQQSAPLEALVVRLSALVKQPGMVDDEALYQETKQAMATAYLAEDPGKLPAEYAPFWERILRVLPPPSSTTTTSSPLPTVTKPKRKLPSPEKEQPTTPLKRQQASTLEWTAPELAANLNARGKQLTEAVMALHSRHRDAWQLFWRGRPQEESSEDTLPLIPPTFSDAAALKEAVEKLLRRAAFAFLFLRRTEQRRLEAAERHAQVAADAKALAIGYETLRQVNILEVSQTELLNKLKDIEMDLVKKLTVFVDELVPEFVNR